MRRALCVLVVACGDDAITTAPDAATGEYTLATCTTTIADDVPEPYRSLFHCADIKLDGSDVVITTSSLPPHRSYYYGSSSPNYEAWDDRGGLYHPNPNTLQRSTVAIVIPLAPVARNVTVGTNVDGVVGTSSTEYRQGPAGIALDSVLLFNPLAAPGDDIADEQWTFDPYNAHPAPGGQYHYHRTSPGPLATLTSGSEVYGVMCDGTFVLGCTELDAATPVQSDLDAQNGHVHEVTPLGTRYHVHMCPAWPDHPRPYTPEIQFYDRCTIR
jgi:hypothetical protein